MKIVLTTTFLVAVLAIGLLEMNNVFAQGDEEMVEENETGLVNSTGIINATLAYAQDNGMMQNDTDGMMGTDEEIGMMMNMSSDHSKGEMKLNGTINVESTIAEAFKSKVTTDIIGAIEAAQVSVGANSFVKEAELTEAHGYLIYKIKVVDENMKKYKVIVDPGNGQVLMKKEVTWCEDYKDKKMKYGDEKGYDKYDSDGGGHDYKDDKYDNHGDKYDKKKIMIMIEGLDFEEVTIDDPEF
jgi:uncharacterized membrane protein YkoI